jgi:hypothetical protein
VIDEAMGDEVRITVIATGFGEHVEDRHAPRAGGEGRPVRRMGTVDEDEVEGAAWQRRGREANGSRRRSAATNGDEGGEDYDVPTFLRRGAE